MARTKISEFSSTPANNTDIDSINIAEGCAPSNINDAIRELMAQLKDFQTGAQGDSFNGPIGSSTAGTGAFTTISATGAITSTLATGSAPLVIASTTKVANLNVDLLDGADWASPAALGSTTPAAGSFTTLGASSTATLNTLVSSGATLTGGTINGMTIGATTASTGAFTTLSASSSVTLSGSTANGVTYLNGSKVLTSGSALTFDGSLLSTTVADNTVGVKFKAATSNIRFIPQDSGAAKIAALNAAESAWYPLITQGSSLQYVIDTSEVARFTSTGLGIGTSSPAYKLHTYGSNSIGALVQSTGTLATISFQGSGSSTNYSVRCGTDGQAFVAYTENTERMRLDASGNLGLGVTPSAWTSGAKAIQIGARMAVYNDGFNNALFSNNMYFDGSFNKYIATAASARYYLANDGSHIWNQAPSGTAGDAISFTQAMTLDASGNLGVGTTSPAGRLSVQSGSSNGALTNSVFVFNDGSGAGTGARISLGVRSEENRSAGVSGFYDGTGTTLGFYTVSSYASGSQAERARIDSSGNLLVGTDTTPSGSVGGAGFIRESASRSTFFMASTSTGSATLVVMRNPNGDVGTINTSGSSTAYNTSSDYRLKNTIAPMTGALAKVALLKPCTYKWNADGSDGEGFIAHELAEVVPQCVTGAKDAVDEEGNPKYQGIDTSFLVATLTAALQELNAKFDAYVASHP